MAQKKSLVDWCNKNHRDDLLSEWDNAQNTSSMFSLTPSATYKAYWKCPEGHEWECYVAARTIFDLKCPICDPEMASLPIGTKYGCFTIIGGLEEYEKEVAEKELARSEQSKADFLCGKRNPHSNIDSVEIFDLFIQPDKTRTYNKSYECQCECGKIHHVSELSFLGKTRYCTVRPRMSHRHTAYRYQNLSDPIWDSFCGLHKKQREIFLSSYKREYDESYYINYSNTTHESLDILECVDDNYEKIHSWKDMRTKGGGTFKIYKMYKCCCYLCGKEQTIMSSEFSISPPTEYGERAYGGYYSEAFCDCHKISSFQWIVTKILIENKVPYRVEFSFPELYGAGARNLLRYDFAVLNADNNVKCLIECQGEQHFQPVDEFGGKTQFKVQQQNDALKQTYATTHGIPLYEISYKSKKYEKVESFLKSKQII